MNTHRHTLNFPNQRPSQYLPLQNEPVFNAEKHLQLEKPQSIISLSDLNYTQEVINTMPSSVGITSAFRIFSEEGIQVLYDLCKKMESNKNETAGTGANRLGSYIRGAGYRSKFIKDFCESRELTDFLSEIAQVKLTRHALPSVAGGINYAPDDITKAVDTWHVDSVSFDIVILVVDPHHFKGGEFQYFKGTKQEGEDLLGIKGEAGTQAELPSEKVFSVPFPAAGYGFLQQGNMVFHRACRLLEKAERITFIPSFSVADTSKSDHTNVDVLLKWKDPGILTELARQEIWHSISKLENVIDTIDLNASKDEISQQLDHSIQDIQAFVQKLKKIS